MRRREHETSMRRTFYPTYEELKYIPKSKIPDMETSFYPTYEELKSGRGVRGERIPPLFILPMRN